MALKGAEIVENQGRIVFSNDPQTVRQQPGNPLEHVRCRRVGECLDRWRDFHAAGYRAEVERFVPLVGEYDLEVTGGAVFANQPIENIEMAVIWDREYQDPLLRHAIHPRRRHHRMPRR
ncbi:MAG TPA: hypothetical protein VHN18_17425, partial [Micromonosporaceae bacterium]|nr:hypothetical protein [Micromonosporaceae bacterium]